MTEGVDRFNCRYPATAEKARKYDAGVEAILSKIRATMDEVLEKPTYLNYAAGLRYALLALGAEEVENG